MRLFIGSLVGAAIGYSVPILGIFLLFPSLGRMGLFSSPEILKTSVMFLSDPATLIGCAAIGAVLGLAYSAIRWRKA